MNARKRGKEFLVVAVQAAYIALAIIGFVLSFTGRGSPVVFASICITMYLLFGVLLSTRPKPVGQVPTFWEGFRRFWPYCLPLWLFPPMFVLLHVRFGLPIWLFLFLFPVIGLVSGIPVIRGQMTYWVTEFLYIKLTILFWGLILYGLVVTNRLH